MEFSQNAFGAPTRTLTGLGGAIIDASVVLTSIAAATSVDSRASATHMSLMTVAVKTGATATAAITINVWDGTTSIVAATTAAGANSPAAFTGANAPTVGFRITNTDAAIAGTFLEAAIQFNQ